MLHELLVPTDLRLSLAEMAVWPSITGLIESRSWLPLINHPDYEEEMEECSLTGDDSMTLYYYHSLSQTTFLGENFPFVETQW